MAEGKGYTELPSVIWMRDLDGTGSMHPCAKGDAGAIAYVPEDSINTYPAVEGLVSAVGDLLRWVEPIAGDNRDDAAAANEVLTVEQVKAALSRFRSLQKGGEE